jgi:hypothetical protein
MSRGVSTPHKAIHTVYFDISWMGLVNKMTDDFEAVLDDDGEPVFEYDEWVARENWDDWIEYSVIYPLSQKFKSLYKVDKWLEREDHVLLANDHAWIGVSTYMYVAAVWMVNRHDYYYPEMTEAWEFNLAQAWCERVGKSFRTVLKPDLVHLGGFSNGEQVYRRT